MWKSPVEPSAGITVQMAASIGIRMTVIPMGASGAAGTTPTIIPVNVRDV